MSQHSVPPQQPGYPQPGQQPAGAGQPPQQGGYAQPGYPTPSQGYAQPSAPSQGYAAQGAPQQHYAPQGQPAQQQPWGVPGQQGYGAQYAQGQSEPGFFGRLFDTRFAHLVAPKYVSGAYVVVYIVAGIVTLRGLVGAINLLSYSALPYGGAGSVLSGLVELIVAPVLGLAVLLVGRLAIEGVVHLARSREALEALRENGGSSE